MRKINTHIKSDGTLQIFVGNRLLAEAEDGRDDEEFIEDILDGMGYKWNADGSIERSNENAE
jgi:hypothetical protein